MQTTALTTEEQERPAFPFTTGQRIAHPAHPWPGVVLGWTWRERPGGGGYWVMGVRQEHPDYPGDPARGSTTQSMVDGWVAVADEPAEEGLLADPETVAIAAARRLAARKGEAWHVVEHAGVHCLADDQDWFVYWSNEDGAQVVYTALPGDGR